MHTRTTTSIIAGAALLLAAGCATNGSGSDSPETAAPTEETTEPEDEDPGENGADTLTLGPWVELPARTYFITAGEDRALLATGEQDYGDVITRDVVAVGHDGSDVWAHADVREMNNLPEAVSAGEHLALIDAEAGTPTLRGLAWADGTEQWAHPVSDLLTCTEQVSVQEGRSESVLVDALGPSCDADEPRAVAVSIDAGTGEVRGTLEATGEVTGTTSPEGTQAWYWQMDGGQVQMHSLDLESGQVNTDVIAFDEETRAALTDGEVDMISMWPVSDHQVALQSWQDATDSVLALADLQTGEARMFQEGEPCGHFTASRDVASQTCLVNDDVYEDQGESATAFDFEGNELWTIEGSIGLSLDGGPPVEPVEVNGQRAWLVSAGEDLIQARAVQDGSELWFAGAGEGAGVPSTHQVPGTDEVVLGIQHEPPATQVLRLDAQAGEELGRTDVTDAWVHGNTHAVAVHADEATLLAFATAH